ncbi:hypothetical protein EJB05_24930, partial [Eragrostis curvula]
MQSILRSALRLRRRPSVFPVARGAPRRFAYEPWLIQHGIGVRSEKEQVKLERTVKVMDEANMSNEIKDMSGNVLRMASGIWHADILESSSHHDGSIYKRNWNNLYCMDMSDRTESK